MCFFGGGGGGAPVQAEPAPTQAPVEPYKAVPLPDKGSTEKKQDALKASTLLTGQQDGLTETADSSAPKTVLG